MSLNNIITGKRGTGWIPNDDDSLDWDVGRMRLLNTDLPKEHSLFKHVVSVRNQRSASSCVGEAVAGAVGIVQNRLGISSEPLSSLDPYWYARYLHGAHKRDAGTRIRLACKAMQRRGIPDEKYWPFSSNPMKVNKQPGPEATMRAHPRSGGSYVSISDSGGGRTQAVRAAISSGFPVVFGTRVNRDFQARNGPLYIGPPPGETIGGHAMVLIGYKVDEIHGMVFEILNSWGRNWRAMGRAWITEGYLCSNLTRDLTIIYNWKSITK